MKTPIILAVAASMLAISFADERVIVREGTTAVQPLEAVGTVTEFQPDTISVRTETAAAPVRYRFSKTTEYVDESGNRVTRDIVKTGVPVTVRYVREGDEMLVNRVIVRKQVTTVPEAVVTKKTTTTTTTTRDKDDDDDDDDDD
jgi:hypothetical protein